MANYKKLFIDHLENMGVKYTDRDEHLVTVSYSGDNIQSIKFHVAFDKDGDGMVQIYGWDIGNFGGDKTDKGIEVCNEMNKKYRWVKFYLDNDNDVCVSTDSYICEANAGSVCLNLVRRMINIVDEAYPSFMRALWA